MAIESRNPATEELIETFEPLSEEEISTALDRAVKAFQHHRKSTFAERSKAMRTAEQILLDEKDVFGRLLTSEMGKTLKSAIAEVEKCASVCRYYAENAEEFLADEEMASDATRSFVRYLPMGPILAVMPWNFPFWQVFRFAAPALMAGNVGLLKHASNVPRSALAIEDIFRRAGFAEGCFQTLLIGSDKVEKVLRDDRVRAATLTGSEQAGAAVAATAGAEIKHTVLELGGSDPFIVMPSADLEKAVNLAVTARTINNGQSCIAAKRFIIHASIYDAFTDRFVAKFEVLRVGDPMKDETDIGPLAMRQIKDEIDDQVRRSIDAGAVRLTGAERIDGKGYFYRPGILADVRENAPAFGDELFGPVAILFKVASLEDAIELGNATRFGLGSALFTEDQSEIELAATNLDAGATFINSMVASDPRLPFGGVKSSGYGRELSRDGIREFVNRKTISIA
jgi:succinate-semialdehyde dehydrogenase/glutarate-semialdehyde dehydrogenase